MGIRVPNQPRGSLEAAVDDYFLRNFSMVREPDFQVALRRKVAKARHNRSFSVSVGTTAVQVVADDPNRIELRVFNFGNATVYIGTPKQVAVGVIGAVNAGYPILTQTEFKLTDNTGELWAISGSAGMDLRVLDLTGEV